MLLKQIYRFSDIDQWRSTESHHQLINFVTFLCDKAAEFTFTKATALSSPVEAINALLLIFAIELLSVNIQLVLVTMLLEHLSTIYAKFSLKRSQRVLVSMQMKLRR